MIEFGSTEAKAALQADSSNQLLIDGEAFLVDGVSYLMKRGSSGREVAASMLYALEENVDMRDWEFMTEFTEEFVMHLAKNGYAPDGWVAAEITLNAIRELVNKKDGERHG